MPELKCTVETCAHNKQCCCELDNVAVNGRAALTCEETCCDSFKDSAVTNADSSKKSASLHSEIACQACDCTHNSDSVCKCECVEIQGSNACVCTDTRCGSFKGAI